MGRHDMFGTRTRVYTGGTVMIKKDSELYGKMQSLTKGERSVLDFMIKYIEKDLNTVTLGGEMRNMLLDVTGLTDGTVKVILSKLGKEGYIDRTVLPNEYLVNPSLVVCGWEEAVNRNVKRIENELRKKKGIAQLM